MRIPLVEALTSGPLPEGSALLIEFDPASQWHNACLTIVAGWLREGGSVSLSVASQPLDRVRSKLRRLGLNPEALETDVEGDETLRIWDWYTISMGGKSKEKYAINSLKVSDLSIFYSQEQLRGPPMPHRLLVIDDGSVLARFNEEKNWVEFCLTRIFPMAKMRKSSIIVSLIRGVHSDWVYKRCEAAADGIVDLRLDESTDPVQNLIRIKAMKDIGFDGRWHRMNTRENHEVTIDK